MMISRPEGTNAVLGKSQGYLGLPVKADNYEDGTPFMLSAWQPSPEEVTRISNGASIHVELLTHQHPPIMLSVGEEAIMPVSSDSGSNGDVPSNKWVSALLTAHKIGILSGADLSLVINQGPSAIRCMIFNHLGANTLTDALAKSLINPVTPTVIEGIISAVVEK